MVVVFVVVHVVPSQLVCEVVPVVVEPVADDALEDDVSAAALVFAHGTQMVAPFTVPGHWFAPQATGAGLWLFCSPVEIAELELDADPLQNEPVDLNGHVAQIWPSVPTFQLDGV
ncbi:hypothetical protein ACG04R_00950 [Roseateles sp. BYS78W]|uniref:Secreted protein n=1 Tax=Pelomonas candidula TaxID=3299025 RepID=A0ABW7H612_9BURK